MAPVARLRSSDLRHDDLNSLNVNSNRLWNSIHSTARWGEAHRYGDHQFETGLSRLALSDTDKHVRDWFVETCERLSCQIHIDEIGNIFAIRPGIKNDVPTTFAGSHLDSQPMGGRFDGVLGVCAGIEMLKVLEENHIETEGPVGVVNWTNEEGARFPMSMMGSGVWAGSRDLSRVYALEEASQKGRQKKKNVLEELERIGYKGKTKATWDEGMRLGGHFELHIEQGPTLEKRRGKVGVVEGVQGYKWFDIQVKGQAAHAGATAYEYRADALLWASRIIWRVRDIAGRRGGLATVGIINSEPQSINTVPDQVTMTLDVRHPKAKPLKEICTRISEYLTELERHGSSKKGSPGINIEMSQIFSSEPTIFDGDAIRSVEDSARNVLNMPTDSTAVRRMVSGAGHDSVNTQKRAPTAMIFVPCKGGVSHHPKEWCDEENCAVGASVLLQSIVRFDQFRYQRGDFE
ncbi:MAG: hypothetical protein LQ351_004829 [Letrouitia transgressa]|nr:MAG: hypothetical protein LQ351_004829 [Letrouitia transgressa]